MSTNYFDNIKNTIIGYFPSIAIAIFIIIIFYIIANYYKNYIINNNIKDENSLRTNSQNLVYYELSWFVYYIIIIVGLLYALTYLGLNITTLVTILGIFGLALGLALQGTLTNIISGIIISILNIFDIGDLIRLNQLGYSNSVEGIVYDFNLYFTTLIDKNTNLIIKIPNSLIQNNILTNVTKSYF